MSEKLRKNMSVDEIVADSGPSQEQRVSLEDLDTNQTSLSDQDLSLFRHSTSLYLIVQMTTYLTQHHLSQSQMSQTSTSPKTTALHRKIEKTNKRNAKRLKNFYKQQGFVLPFVPQPHPRVLSKLLAQLRSAAGSPENYGTPEYYKERERRFREVTNI